MQCKVVWSNVYLFFAFMKQWDIEDQLLKQIPTKLRRFVGYVIFPFGMHIYLFQVDLYYIKHRTVAMLSFKKRY